MKIGELRKQGFKAIAGDTLTNGLSDSIKLSIGGAVAVNNGHHDELEIVDLLWRDQTSEEYGFSGVTDYSLDGWRPYFGSLPNVEKQYKDDTRRFVESVQVSANTKLELIHKSWVDLNGKIENGCEDMLTIWHVIGGNFANGDYYFSSRDICREPGAKFICTVKEFNDYCEKMKESVGDDFISIYQLATPSDKPTFTQAMADAYIMPPVGSWFTLNYYEHDSRFNDMNGHDFEVIGINDDVYTFRSDTKGFGALRLNPINCQPIDNRTKKQKAVDAAIAEWPAADKATLELAYDLWAQKIEQ